jgi:hypothetical protein
MEELRLALPQKERFPSSFVFFVTFVGHSS